MKFLNKADTYKLRAGHTVWRCQIMESGKVSISEIFLSGPKVKKTVCEGVAFTKVGRNYLGDLVTVPCFARKKYALKFQATVNEPQYADLRESAQEHWEECAMWEREYDYV